MILFIFIELHLQKGRAIRHRGDYSSMVLCDRRYSRPATLAKLPTWIKDRTSTHTTFGPAFAALRKVRSEHTLGIHTKRGHIVFYIFCPSSFRRRSKSGCSFN